MQARTYCAALATSSAVLFLAVATTNLVIDAQGAFGTRLIPSRYTNDRLTKFAAYEAAADAYDGLLFGSSRSRLIPPDEVSKRMNARFADFSIDGGMLPDHLPVLEYVVRQKAAQKKRLNAVLLMLDIDTFGNPEITNRFNNTILPPALTGEGRVRFWWRHLTWIQFYTWRRAIREAWRIAQSSDGSPGLFSKWADRLLSEQIVGAAQAQTLVHVPAPGFEPIVITPIRQRPDFDGQLQLLQRFAQLCRDNGIRLLVVLSPLHGSNPTLRDPDLDQAIERIASIVPVWDFAGSPELHSDVPGHWHADKIHFSAELGLMMLRRIFGDDLPEGWRDFGRRRG